MREVIEYTIMKILLALPVSMRLRLFGSGPPPVRDTVLHPDFATLLGVRNLLRMPSLETIGQRKGMAAARAEYRHVFRMGARSKQPMPVTTQDWPIPNGADTLPARLYKPNDPVHVDALLLYFHGGGFILGDLDAYDPLLKNVSIETGIKILSVDYRLAPEHPFPAGVEDAITAAQYVTCPMGQEALGITRVLVGGDSAGGTLALEATYALVEYNTPPVGLWLLNPCAHVREHYPSDSDFAEGYGFTRAMRDWFEETYMPDTAKISDPKASPLFLPSFKKFPPTWLSFGACDPLRDQIELLAQRLREDDAMLDYRMEPGMIHNYFAFLGLSQDAHAALRDACQWVQHQLDKDA